MPKPSATSTKMPAPKHSLKPELAGPIVCTPDAKEQFGTLFIMACLHLFFMGDWGSVDSEDAAMNNEAADAANGSRILASYGITDDERLWIIADGYGNAHLGPDHCHVTVLTPSEY